MLQSLASIVIIFALTRFTVKTYGRSRHFADVFSVVVGLVFALGLMSFTTFFGTPQIAAQAPPPPAITSSAAATTPARAPAKARLTLAELAALSPSNVATQLGSIDALTLDPAAVANNTSNIFRATKVLYARGWAANAASKTPVSGIVLIIDYKKLIDGSPFYGSDRSDVAQAYGSSAMGPTGFDKVPIPTAGLRAGHHVLQLAVVSSDRKHYDLVAAPIIKFTLE